MISFCKKKAFLEACLSNKLAKKPEIITPLDQLDFIDVSDAITKFNRFSLSGNKFVTILDLNKLLYEQVMNGSNSFQKANFQFSSMPYSISLTLQMLKTMLTGWCEKNATGNSIKKVAVFLLSNVLLIAFDSEKLSACSQSKFWNCQIIFPNN